MENERQSWQSWNGWCPCAKFRKQLGRCFSWKILWAPRAGTKPRSETSELPSRLKEFHTGAPKRRRALQRPIDLPDDEFPEEPHVEEARVPEEIPNAVMLAVMGIHKNLGHPSKELLCRALGIGGANKIAIRAASELKCERRTNIRKVICLRSWQIHTPNSIKVKEWISLYSRTQTNKCLSS